MSKKIRYVLIFAITFCVHGVFAQNVTVSGTVIDFTGTPIPGVNVIEKGTINGTSTDFDGNYSLSVSNNATLSFSYIGYQTQEIVVGNQTVINVTLEEDTQLLDEVVVTALGIKKEKKALSYAVQEVSSQDLGRASDGNINTALQSKVAGVNITTSGGVTGNARIEIRGPSSLGGADRVPLWVIDGVPFSANEATDATDLFGGISNGGGLLDINPDDIESISVLKGGQAAALYGTRGANGVILVTTKSGQDSKGLGISYSTSTTFSEAAFFLDLQKEYGQGINGEFDPRSRSSWGGRLDGTVRQAWTGEQLPYAAEENLIEDFVRTAVNTRHAISFSNSNDQGHFRASILSDKNEGVFENNQLRKLNFDVRASYDINPWLNLDTKISWIRNRGQQRPDIGFYSFISQLNGIPPNIRTEDLAAGSIVRNEENFEFLFGPNLEDLTANPNANNRNPYFIQQQIVNSDQRNRMFGYLAANIKLMDDLTLMLKYGIDFYRYETLAGFRFRDNVDITRPNLTTTETFFKEDNLEFLLRYNKDFGNDFNFGLNVGGNQMRNDSETLEARSGRLTSQNDFFLNAGTNRTTFERFSAREIQSIYGSLDVSYKDYLFFTATARNDWSSALLPDNNSFFYPSFGLSGLISEMIELPDWISYLKVRANWAQLGKDTVFGDANPVFILENADFNLLRSETPNLSVSPDLKPEISSTADIGLDLRMFNNRFDLNITYYDERTDNQILRIPFPQSSGFTERTINAGLITNRGIELIATVVPIRTQDFNLGLTFNFARNRSVLEEYITPEDDNEFHPFFQSNTIPEEVRAEEGELMGDIYGFAYERDDNGNIIVGEDGLPVRTQEIVKLGNIQADFTGSIAINANYKNFSLSALFGMQQGGDIYSLTEASATGGGNSLKSTSLGRQPFFVDGIRADGGPNLQIVEPQAYWGRVSGITEEFIYDASFMKLNELSLSYSMPSSLLNRFGNGFISNVRLSLIARNLFYLYRDTPGTVPDAAVFNTQFGAQAFDFSPVPLTRSLGFALNLNF
ncbi:SusC/RagA family TonB-linked outer membrane protein [Flavobacteriaceae bacterium GF1]